MKLLKLLKRYDWRNYIIYYSIYGVMILIALWILLSYVNIVMHNSAGDETFTYWRFNFFRLFDLIRR